MRVKDVMRREYISFQADDTLGYVVKKLVKNKITSAPVFDEGEFLGIVSDMQIVKYFMPKKFVDIWKKSEPKPEELQKTLVTEFLLNPTLRLRPEQELRKVLSRIVREVNCIPVFENRKLVGIVRSEDMNKVFLQAFAKGGGVSSAKEEKSTKIRMDTEIDKIVSIVEERGRVSARALAKELGISFKAVEKLAECLAKNYIIEIRYPLFKGLELRRIEREKEKR